MIALDRLPAAAPDVLHRHAFNLGLVDGPHSDVELLNACDQLGVQRDEWQRLWVATPEKGRKTKADRAWERFHEDVWPSYSGGLPATLTMLQATTPEGMAAKAAAICAMGDAALWFGDCRNDLCEIEHSLITDVAGPVRRLLGGDAP